MMLNRKPSCVCKQNIYLRLSKMKFHDFQKLYFLVDFLRKVEKLTILSKEMIFLPARFSIQSWNPTDGVSFFS